MKPASIGIFAAGVLSGIGMSILYRHLGHVQSPPVTEESVKTPISPSIATGEDPHVPSASPIDEEPALNEPINTLGTPVKVSREFDRMLSTDRPGGASVDTIRMHARLEKEPRDPIWAAATEAAYLNFFQGKPELLRYGTPEVDCRMSMCELRLVVASGDKNIDWGQLMTRPGTLPPPEGGLPLVFDRDEHDGITATMVHTFFRDRPGNLVKSPPRE